MYNDLGFIKAQGNPRKRKRLNLYFLKVTEKKGIDIYFVTSNFLYNRVTSTEKRCADEMRLCIISLCNLWPIMICNVSGKDVLQVNGVS